MYFILLDYDQRDATFITPYPPVVGTEYIVICDVNYPVPGDPPYWASTNGLEGMSVSNKLVQ